MWVCLYCRQCSTEINCISYFAKQNSIHLSWAKRAAVLLVQKGHRVWEFRVSKYIDLCSQPSPEGSTPSPRGPELGAALSGVENSIFSGLTPHRTNPESWPSAFSTISMQELCLFLHWEGGTLAFIPSCGSSWISLCSSSAFPALSSSHWFCNPYNYYFP